jgi:hypothetical protein
MINPNGDDFTKNNPLPGPTQPSEAQNLPGSPSRFQETTDGTSAISGGTSDMWSQTKERAGMARERTEFFLRENPIPTILGALAVGLAIGLAIRYSSEAAEKEAEVKTRFGDVNLGMLSLPFMWPLFKSVRQKYEDSADAVKEGVDKLKDMDVDRYVKPLRKKWRSWTN